MQQIECPLCDSPDSEPVALHHDRLLGIDGQFSMVRCTCCGLCYLNPQPTMAELVRYYPEDYDPFETPPPDQIPLPQRASVSHRLHKRKRAVTRHKRSGHLLEIGCANGLFLHAMRQTNDWQVQGVEVSEPAVHYARERLGLDVFHGPLEDAQLPEHFFDVVVMWDVLEHVHSPKDTLRETHRVLKPDGVLVFRLPLLDSWDRKLFGPYWAGWDAPRHLTLFSRHTLDMMLTSAGFRVDQIDCTSGGYTGFVLSIRFWAGEHLSAPAQSRLRRVLEALPLRIATAPYFYLVGRLGKNTFTTVVALPNGSGNLSERMDDSRT